MKRKLQDPPFTIKVESTEGCTLACSFCAIQTIRENGADSLNGVHGKLSSPYKFMTVETAERIGLQIKEAGWNPRIEFAMHGEPTVNPKLPELIHAIRKHNPKISIMVTSNGSGVMKEERILRLFDAGLNTLALDDYKHADFVPKIRPLLTKAFSVLHGIEIYNYPAQSDGNPYNRFYKRRIVVIDDISVPTTEGVRHLTNQGGNSRTKDDPELPLQKRCAKPFRDMTFRWDGKVGLCCDDWRGEYKIGDITKEDIVTIWNNDKFNAARTFLYAGDRASIKICSRCSATTYRNGLLPDKYGKESMPKPTEATRRAVAEAERGKVFTIKLSN